MKCFRKHMKILQAQILTGSSLGSGRRSTGWGASRCRCWMQGERLRPQSPRVQTASGKQTRPTTAACAFPRHAHCLLTAQANPQRACGLTALLILYRYCNARRVIPDRPLYAAGGRGPVTGKGRNPFRIQPPPGPTAPRIGDLACAESHRADPTPAN